MNVSWQDQNERLAALSSLYISTQTQNSSNSDEASAQDESLNWIGGSSDSVSLSAEGLALSRMPPPEKPDFANMTDEELSTLLQQIQDSTGSIPGVEDSETTDITELTEEQLQEARDALSELMEMLEEASRKRADNNANQTSAPAWMTALQGTEGTQGMNGMQGPPPPPPSEAVNSLSDEDLTSLLTTIQEETGSIPGIEDSETTDAATLTEEQLETARDAVSEMMRQRMDEMMQTMRMSQAITAYTAGSAVS